MDCAYGLGFAIFNYPYGVERTARVDETSYRGPTLEKARSFITDWVELTVFLANGR